MQRDSVMPKLIGQLELDRCPHCGVDTPTLQLQPPFFQTKSIGGGVVRTWGVYVCSRCGGVITASAFEAKGYVRDMYPSSPTVDEAVPERAKIYLEQAMRSINAPAGAVMLAASSVDAMLKEKGYKEGSLYARINQANKDHLITDGMGKWAHEVRLDANDQRHADESSTMPTVDDARHCIDFVLALGQFLFVLPARVERGRAEAAA